MPWASAAAMLVVVVALAVLLIWSR